VADRTVIVIGAGMAGLASGIYARACGHDTTVFEMHTGPGGVCTAWERDGYVFDGCLHWLVGGEQGTTFRPLWDEVGADDLEFIAHDTMSTVRDLHGNELVFWSDRDRLEASMRERWPDEEAGIKALVKGSRTMAKAGFDIPDVPPDMMGLLDGLRMLAKSGLGMIKMRKYQMMPIATLAGLFKDPFLRRAVGNAMIQQHVSAMTLLATLAWVDGGDACWVRGGSRTLARKLEQRLLDLGGTIEYLSKVDRVLVEGDRAVGVRLTDGTEHRADYVVSAADGHATIFDMLEGRYADDRIRELYDKLEPFTPLIQVSLGVDRDLSDEPWSVVLLLDEGTQIGGAKVDAIWTRHYSYDNSMARAGKSCVTTVFAADLARWEGLKRQGREVYAAAKDEVGRQLIEFLEHAYPGTRDRIEVVDVATPTTYVRYTGNWQASYQGWLMSPENARLSNMSLPQKLPGLSHFVMAGQWVSVGGGLPSVVLSGRWAVQTMCAEMGTTFRAPSTS
jgi:phytoene dehydrogenase-like protein